MVVSECLPPEFALGCLIMVVVASQFVVVVVFRVSFRVAVRGRFRVPVRGRWWSSSLLQQISIMYIGTCICMCSYAESQAKIETRSEKYENPRQ